MDLSFRTLTRIDQNSSLGIRYPSRQQTKLKSYEPTLQKSRPKNKCSSQVKESYIRLKKLTT